MAPAGPPAPSNSCSNFVNVCYYQDPEDCHLSAGERITGFACSGTYGINKIIPVALRHLPGMAWVAFTLLLTVFLYQAGCLAIMMWTGHQCITKGATSPVLHVAVKRSRERFALSLDVTELVMKLTMTFLALAADKYAELSVSLVITLLIAGLFINISILKEEIEAERGEAFFTSIEALIFILCLSVLNCDKAMIRIATAAFVILLIIWAVALVCRHFHPSLRSRVAEAASLGMLILALVHLYAKKDNGKYRIDERNSPVVVSTIVLTVIVVLVVWVVRLTPYWKQIVGSVEEVNELHERELEAK